MEFPVVTVGYIESDTEEFNTDSANSLIMQSYPKIELIVSINNESKVPLDKVFCIIDFGAKENIVSVKWHVSQEKLEPSEHIKYICDHASGEYITFLQSNTAFYEQESLERAMRYVKMQNDKDSWQLKTVVFLDNTFKQAVYVPNVFGKSKPSMNDKSFIFRPGRIDKRSIKDGMPLAGILVTLWKRMNHSTIDVNFIRDIGRDNTNPLGLCNRKRFNSNKSRLERKSAYDRCRIRLLFIANEYFVWPSLKSVYEASLRDHRFEAKIVYTPFKNTKSWQAEAEIKAYTDAGYSIEKWEEFDLEKYDPDILFYLKPYDELPPQFQLDTIRAGGRKIVYSTYAMNTIGLNETLIKYNFTLPMITCAWLNVSYSKIHSEKFESFSLGKSNYVKSGHPRFDLSLKDMDCLERRWYDEICQRAKGRKIVLWNTHHTIGEKGVWGCFLEMWETMLSMISQHTDELFFVWRPHPLFFKKLTETLGMHRASEIRNEFLKLENIALDETPTYFPAMLASTALISEISSLVEEYLITGKSIFLYVREENGKYIDWRFFPVVYSNLNGEALKKFCSNVINGEDAKAQCRKAFAESNYYLPGQGKTVGEELLDLVYKRFKAERDKRMI